MDEARARFSSLFDEHYRSVFAFVLRRVDTTQTAQDLTEDAFLVAWRKLEAVPADPESLYWLYGVARRIVANHSSKSANRTRLAPRLVTVAPLSAPPPEDVVVRNDEARFVIKGLEELRHTDQELLRLAYWDDLPRRVIGELLGISESAVSVRLHRAVRRLGKALRHSGHFADEGPLPRTVPEEC